MEDLGYHDALALLDWQIELGADEAILDTPVDRFALEPAPVAAPVPARAGMPAQTDTAPSGPVADAPPAVDAVLMARTAAEAATDLPGLRAAIEAFGLCPLSLTARNFVFADGPPDAHVMIVVDAPALDEDRQGIPVAGQAAALLDHMLAAIGLSKTADDPAKSVYIAPMLPWRPPQDRDPTQDEIAMLAPFMRRHIDLVAPRLLVLMGNHPCQGLLDRKGISRLRGNWTQVMDRPAIAMFHPADLLRKPHEKARAWDDLLSLQAKIRTL
jgi:DNA polymerase